MIGILKAQPRGQPFRIRAALAPHLPGLAHGDGKLLPVEASVEVFEVAPRGIPVMAFVRVTPKGADPCEADRQKVFALHIVREGEVERIVLSPDAFQVSETKLFDGTERRAVFPRTPARVPVFEVHFDHQPSCPGLADRGPMVEVYHLSSAGRMSQSSIDTEVVEPGKRHRVRSRISWIAGKVAGTAHLVEVSLSTGSIHPCTGDPNHGDSECLPTVECERGVTVVAATATDSRSLEPAEIASLKRQDPAFAKVPEAAKGDSESACLALAP